MKKTGLKAFSIFLLFLLFVLTVSLSGSEIFETSLDNGLTLLIREDHSVPLVAVRVCYHVGIKNECPGLTGITSICEAIMWQGTRAYKKGEIARIIQAGGGYTSSFTDWDVTHFYSRVPSDMLDTVLMLEADRMAGTGLTSEKLLLSKDIVRKKRLSEVESSIYGRINEEYFNLAYRAHPYGHNKYGWPDDINRINLDDLKKHFRAYFQPSNAVLVIAGDLETEAIVKRVTELFGNINSRPMEERRPISEPESIGDRRSVIVADIGVPAIIMGYRIPGISHPDYPVLNIITNILGTGTSSRIYQRMVNDEKSAMYTDGGIIMSEEPGLIYFYALLNYDSPVEDAEKQMSGEIKRIKDEMITEAELEKAKNQVVVNYYRNSRTLDDITRNLGTARFITGDVNFGKHLVNAVHHVSTEKIIQTAQKYFKNSNRIVVVISPPEAGDAYIFEEDHEEEHE